MLDYVKNACMHVWGHEKLGCNGVLIERFPLAKDSRAEGVWLPNSGIRLG